MLRGNGTPWRRTPAGRHPAAGWPPWTMARSRPTPAPPRGTGRGRGLVPPALAGARGRGRGGPGDALVSTMSVWAATSWRVAGRYFSTHGRVETSAIFLPARPCRARLADNFWREPICGAPTAASGPCPVHRGARQALDRTSAPPARAPERPNTSSQLPQRGRERDGGGREKKPTTTGRRRREGAADPLPRGGFRVVFMVRATGLILETKLLVPREGAPAGSVRVRPPQTLGRGSAPAPAGALGPPRMARRR